MRVERMLLLALPSLFLAACQTAEVTSPPARPSVSPASNVGPATSQYEAVVLADAPVAYYRLGEALGATVAVDASGGGHDGAYANNVMLGMPGLVRDTANTAVNFGTLGAAYIPHSGSLDFVNAPFTIEAWVNGPLDIQARIFDNIVAGTGLGYGLDIANSNIRFLAITTFTVYTALLPNTTYHIVAESDGTGTATIFLNGSAIGSGSYQNSLINSGQARIGIASDGGAHFNGVIDEVAIYPYALTASQVQAHYQAGANQPPVADAGGPYSGAEGSAISFSGAGSTDPNNDSLTYAWDFGDGSTGTGVAPSHAYADNGSYTVTLTVSDGQLSGSDTTMATVTNVAPSAMFTNLPNPSTEGSPFTLSLIGVTDPSSVDVAAGFTFAFDCGSGTFGPPGPASSAICTPNTFGTLSVRGQVQDKDGGSTTVAAIQGVNNKAPMAGIRANGPTTIPRGTAFKLNATFADAPGDSLWTVTINWGNGTTTKTSSRQWTSVLRQRVYGTAGTFRVNMTVQDRGGLTGTSNSLTVRVQ